MRMTILKKKPGYALGIILCIIGLVLLFLVLWKLWTADVFSSSDLISAMTTQLSETSLEIASGFGLKLIHYTIIGVLLLVAGGVILIARREKVIVTEEIMTLLECPHCKNQWQEPISKAQLQAMGYPKVRTLSRRKCSKCAKFMRPKIVATKK